MDITEFLREGKLVEHSFTTLVATDNDKVVLPTKEQDIKEHWDVQINGIKYDVKGLKKKNREDKDADENINWIEYTNVNGKPGWVKGEANYIVFETQNEWLVVDRIVLLDMIEEKVPIGHTYEKEIYKMYARKNRYDEIVLVPTADLRHLADKIYTK